ncbi:hypothetical protein, partial [Fluoribacter gormanii]|uniref:hypothetical protein n=1 Tax=Fluoribacter gormanii TaxID=464 RepID=UPI001A948CBA
KHDKSPMAGLQDNRRLQDLTDLLNKFQGNMLHHKENGNMENALKELARFNGALASFLVGVNAVEKKEQAIAAINFVRDFLWIKDISMPICVIEDQDPIQVLRYAEPMTFGQAKFKRAGSATDEPINFWDGAQPWKDQLAKAVGYNKQTVWFKHFLDANLKDMKSQSSTPMSRYTPNPANAFDCTDIIVENSEVTHLSSHERVAITEPLSVGNTSSRQDVTDWNHLQLVSTARLKSGLNSFMEKWGDFLRDEEPIPFTILHQTLIGDEVTFSPDQAKAKASKIQASVIDSKEEANAAVRKMLENSIILRNKDTHEIEFLSKDQFKEKYKNGTPNNLQTVNVDLLETNNGINMWSARTRVRNNDYNDARQLIGNAVNMFEKIAPNNQNLNTVIDFLNSSDHSLFTPFKFRGELVKDAIKNLTSELRNGQGNFSNLSRDVRENIALSVQAAVELKCTVHETWLGSARRNIANFTRDYVRQVPVLGHLLDWTVRGAMTVAALGLKAITLPISLPQWIKHRGDRQEMYKSTYEGILAESLGSLRGGCMSSADRALEQAEQRAMMKKQFALEGKIISYNDSADEKARVYEAFGRTRTKHASAENATGTPGTSDDETRGSFLNARAGVLSYIAETEEEQKLAKDLSGLRKGKYSEVSAQNYLDSLPVGSKPYKAPTPTFTKNKLPTRAGNTDRVIDNPSDKDPTPADQPTIFL